MNKIARVLLSIVEIFIIDMGAIAWFVLKQKEKRLVLSYAVLLIGNTIGSLLISFASTMP